MSIILNGVKMDGKMKFGPLNFTPTYLITPNSISINEGDIVTFNVTTTNVPDNTTLYWTASGTATSADFTDSAMSGSFVITGGAGSITRTLSNDLMTEGSENLYINVRIDSTLGDVVASSAMVVIGDTSFTVTDPVFNYVSLLLNGDSVNAAQNNTFVDSSPNALTITRNGNTTQGSFSPFSSNGWSVYFDGASAFSTSHSSFAVGTNNFTVEAWINIPTSTSGSYVMDTDATGSAGNTARLALYVSGGEMSLYSGSANVIDVLQPGLIIPGTWVHVAWVRSSGTVYCYVNGVQKGSAVCTNNFTNSNMWLGQLRNGVAKFTGNMSNFRFVNGTAVYTSNFTPSTAPLTAISGTSLLTLQDNRFKDNSVNNFALDRTGTPKIVASSPFAPTATYSPTINGGSMYFNGASYLSLPSPIAAIGTQDFTWECWINPTTVPATNYFIYGGRGGGTDNTMPYMLIQSTGYSFSTDGTTIITYASPPVANVWTHYAIVRQGTGTNNTKMYVNGVMVAQVTNNLNFSSTNGGFVGHANGATPYNFVGYISGLRTVHGTAVYTTNFTPPTTPLTAIAGTTLLLNGTNAAIYDVAGKNDLETVSTAQISTTQKKFGTGSMKFNGTSDALVLPVNSPELTFGTGNFTVEAWVYPLVQTGTKVVMCGQNDAATAGGSSWVAYISAAGATSDLYIGGTAYAVASPNPAANTWSHVAYVRNGSSWSSYLNGVLVGTTNCGTGAINVGSTTYPPKIGMGATSAWFNGYIDDLRVTKGVARYTTTFTPPTAALPVQ